MAIFPIWYCNLIFLISSSSCPQPLALQRQTIEKITLYKYVFLFMSIVFILGMLPINDAEVCVKPLPEPRSGTIEWCCPCPSCCCYPRGGEGSPPWHPSSSGGNASNIAAASSPADVDCCCCFFFFLVVTDLPPFVIFFFRVVVVVVVVVIVAVLVALLPAITSPCFFVFFSLFGTRNVVEGAISVVVPDALVAPATFVAVFLMVATIDVFAAVAVFCCCCYFSQFRCFYW